MKGMEVHAGLEGGMFMSKVKSKSIRLAVCPLTATPSAAPCGVFFPCRVEGVLWVMLMLN
jgi:hypothetical protein